MKFNVFSFIELRFTAIVTFIVALITIASCRYFFVVENKDTTFIVGIVYALLLFIIGLYITHMNNRVNNMFYCRKQYYQTLLKLDSLFSRVNYSAHNYDEKYSFILFHQLFTGRVEKYEENIYIKSDCFVYMKKYLDVEEKYSDEYSRLKQLFNNNVIEYINRNRLVKKVPNPSISNLYKFVIHTTEWIDEYLDINEEQKKPLINYITDMIVAEKHLKNIKKYRNSLNQKDNKILSEIRKIKNRLEQIYGDRLSEEIEKDNTFRNGLISLDSLITDIINNMITIDSINEIQTDIRDLQHNISQIEDKIDNIDELCDSISDSQNNNEDLQEILCEIETKIDNINDICESKLSRARKILCK